MGNTEERMRSLIVLVALALHGQCSVLDLSDGTFDTNVVPETRLFIAFVSPDCGHCQQFKPHWNKLAASMETERAAVIATVNGPENPQLLKRFGVPHFPFLVLLHEGQMFRFPGSRDPDKLMAFAKGPNDPSTAEAIPGKPHWVAPYVAAFWPDIVHILELRKNAAALLFLSGVAFGSLGTRLMERRVAGSSKAKTA